MSASIPPLPPQPPPPPAWRDRSRALVGYGWLLIVCGALCLLFVLLTSALVLLAPATSAAPAAGRALAVNAVVYGLLGAALITLGVGSIGARRWARAIVLVLAWCWLLTGIMTTLLLVFVLPGAFAASGMPGSTMTCGLVFVFAFDAVLLIALPLVLVLFYRRDDVRRTVEWRNPKPAWTDGLSPTLLAVFLAFLLGGIVCLALTTGT